MPGNEHQRYLVSALKVSKNNTELKIDRGATLVISDNRDKWPNSKHAISGTHLSNIAVTGDGLIDGQGKVWWEHRDNFRPEIINFGHTNHVLISSITIINPPSHCLELYSDYTEVSHVKIFAPPSTHTKHPSHNTDAVDVHG